MTIKGMILGPSKVGKTGILSVTRKYLYHFIKQFKKQLNKNCKENFNFM